MKTMNQNFYPVFKANQVLTHNDLNNSFKYLNEQVSLTRANLIGTGIICGLNVLFGQETGKIHISKGCGITSGKVRPVSKERTSCDINSGGHYIALEKDTVYEYYRRIECDCLSGSILSGREIYELADISPNDMSTSEGVKYTKINDSLFSRQPMVILCYESKEYSQLCSSCGGQSYTSPDNVITIRPLLVVTSVETPTADADDFILNFISPLQRLNVEGSSVANIYSDIKDLLKERLTDINTAIDGAKSIFKETLKANAPSGISEKIITETTVVKQNHYDFISDLTEAYEEFRQCGEKILLNQRLSEEEFPCHLILNGDYRHNFRPALVDYSELNRLWERLVAMIQYFNETPPAPPAIPNAEGTVIPQSAIRLTPSVYGAVPLSQKAVPYYYHKTIDGQPVPQVIPYNVWTGDKNDERGIGYWYKDEDPQKKYYGYYYQESWKNYDLEQYNFVRIEGHVGVEYKEAKISIDKEIKLHELPIKTIGLHLPIKQESDCISPYQDNAFDLLKINFIDKRFVKGLYEIIFDFLNTNVDNLTKTNISETTWLEKINNVITAAKGVKDAAKGVKDAAKGVKDAADTNISSKVLDAEKAVTTVQANVSNEKTKFQDMLTALGDDSGIPTNFVDKIRQAKKYAVDLVENIENAMSIIAAIKKISIKNDLRSHIEEGYIETRNNYESIASFSKNIESGSYSQKIISFLQWLDATYATYQQCKEFSSFGEFQKKHPGLQHKSGVPIGGTFILVYDDKNKVIADFCLPYRVTQPD